MYKESLRCPQLFPIRVTPEFSSYDIPKINRSRRGNWKAVVNAAYRVHSKLGPGLLEKVYEVCVTHELRKAGFAAARQADIPIQNDGIVFQEGLTLDLLVESKVILEMMAVELVNPVWQAQILSHLKLTGLRLGHLLNFDVPLIKNGIRRLVL